MVFPRSYWCWRQCSPCCRSDRAAVIVLPSASVARSGPRSCKCFLFGFALIWGVRLFLLVLMTGLSCGLRRFLRTVVVLFYLRSRFVAWVARFGGRGRCTLDGTLGVGLGSLGLSRYASSFGCAAGRSLPACSGEAVVVKK